MPAPRLIVLPPSHYCERARWALDHAGIAYTEVSWAPGLHIPLARRLAPNTSLPILDTGTTVLQGSGRILDWTGMPGGDPALEQRFEQIIGPLVRQYIYAATLSDPASGIRDLLLHGVPAVQARVGRLLWPVTRRLMIASMNARAPLLPELEAKLAAELDWFGSHLAGRHYLAGDCFGRADLTAASLLAPLARPAACPLYRKARLPQRLQETLARWTIAPSLSWVTRTYQTHRHPMT